MKKSISFKIDQISQYFIYLIPFALLTGPFLPDLFLSIVVLLFIANSLINDNSKYFKNRFFFVFIIFCIYLIVTSLISDFSFSSLESSVVYFRFGLFSLAIWYLIDKNNKFHLNFFIFFLLAFLIAIFSGFYQYFFSETIFGATPKYQDRLLLLTSDQLLLGQYLARLFPLMVALIMFKEKLNTKLIILFFLLFISCDVLVYISGERTALGLLFLGTIFVLIFISKLKTFRILTIICSIIIIILISIYNPSIKERNIDTTIKQLGINSSKINMFSPEHESHIMSAWLMFKKSPIFGVGPNTFKYQCHKKEFKFNDLSCSTHPHNSYMQVLAETGIIGFIFILYAIYIFSKLVIKHIAKLLLHKERYLTDYQICLIACVICSLWPILPTLNVFNNWINIIYYLPVGFLLHSFYSTR